MILVSGLSSSSPFICVLLSTDRTQRSLEHLVDCYGIDALLLLLDADLEPAVGTRDIVVHGLVAFSDWEPASPPVKRGEGNGAWNIVGGGQVHRAAVRT